MTKKQATKIAERFFKSYPAISVFNITSDGRAFENVHNAIAHTKVLDDKEVHSITRAEAGGDVKEIAAEVAEITEVAEVAVADKKKGKK